MGIRFALVVGVVLLVYGGITLRLYGLQIERGEAFAVKAESQSADGRERAPLRGGIFFTDKNGSAIPAAMQRYYPSVYAVPKSVENPGETAERLAPILGVSADSLLPALQKKNDPFERLARRVSEETASAVREAKLAGIAIENIRARYYPGGELGAHVVGFVTEGVGKYGIEAAYDDRLAGSMNGGREPESGEDIYLTIDRTIQAQSEKVLRDLTNAYGAEGGMVIVLEPKTGAVLALTATPTFDPNAYGSAEMKRFLNPAVQAVYEPGSVFKVLTMAAGIDAGKVAPETEYTDTGEVVIGKYRIQNWDHKANGRVTMTRVLERSINTGTVFVERAMGHETFYRYLERFGVGERTGIDLPGEVAGQVNYLNRGGDVQYATASFGQGIALSPIRLLAAVASLGNGGVMLRPRLGANEAVEELGRPVSAETARKVTEMMVKAVDGAEVAKIPGYSVAGKTGTAYVPDFTRGGYTDEVINTYIGFAPAKNPRFVALVRIDKPAGAPVAGLTVVPAFRDLAQFILNYYDTAPDRPEEVDVSLPARR